MLGSHACIRYLARWIQKYMHVHLICMVTDLGLHDLIRFWVFMINLITIDTKIQCFGIPWLFMLGPVYRFSACMNCEIWEKVNPFQNRGHVTISHKIILVIYGTNDMTCIVGPLKSVEIDIYGNVPEVITCILLQYVHIIVYRYRLGNIPFKHTNNDCHYLGISMIVHDLITLHWSKKMALYKGLLFVGALMVIAICTDATKSRTKVKMLNTYSMI